MELLRIQHETDKKRRLEQHEIDLKEARVLLDAKLAQQNLRNEVELKALKNKCDEEKDLRKGMLQKEFEQWKVQQMAILQEEEDEQVRLEYKRMEQNVKTDIERCQMATSSD
eukprot:scaffold7575_cov73-Skeletonema_marinoi.AAC.1